MQNLEVFAYILKLLDEPDNSEELILIKYDASSQDFKQIFHKILSAESSLQALCTAGMKQLSCGGEVYQRSRYGGAARRAIS